MSGNVNLKRIYILHFLEKINVLWEGTYRDQMRFAYAMIDIDHDGILNGPDLLNTQESIDMSSEFGHELQLLIDHFVKTHLKIRTRINPNDYLDIDNYIKVLGNKPSCVIQELKLKLISKAGKYCKRSVFFKGTTATNVTKGAFIVQTGKRAVLQWGEEQVSTIGHKNISTKNDKHVTFAYVPLNKLGDDDNKKKLIKDMPMDKIELGKEYDDDD